MGRSVVAPEYSLTTLKNLSKESYYRFGLILGQSTAQKDYVVHLACTNVQSPDETKDPQPEGGDKCCVKELDDYDDSWIKIQTNNVMMMLPGGMSVLGVFVACPQSSSDTAVFNKLRTLAIHSYNSIKNNNHLHLLKNSDRILLQYTSNNKTYVCKTIDAGSLNASLQPVDFKFTNEPFKWYSVDSSVNLFNFSPLVISKAKGNYSMKKMLQEMLTVFSSKVESCECSVDNKFVNMTDDLKTFKEKEERKIKELEKSTGKKLQFDSRAIKIQLYERKLPEESSFKVDHAEESIEVNFKGDISSRIFITGSTTLEEAVKALKEDLVRCCFVKFDNHWETNDDVFIIKNGEKISDELHVLPRRVLFNIPNSDVQFSQYLFLDETAEDVIPSIQENLGIEIDQSSILDVLEAKCEISSIPSQPEIETSSKIKKVSWSKSNNLFVISLIMISTLVLIISLYIQFTRN